MEFNRNIHSELTKWKYRRGRKPVLIMGARQIGKTTILKSFGKKEFEHVVYLNLEKQLDVHIFFEGNKDPEKIIENLGLLVGQKIVPGQSLLIIDEIQECRDAVISLKYFAEELADLHVVGVGSLLGLSIGNDRSFPVGKVEFINMYPLTFEEYIQTADETLYNVYWSFLDKETIEPLPSVFLNKLKELHKEYLLFGGMPEVASTYLVDRNVEDAQTIQDQILRAYELDFVKHAEKSTSTKIQQVWNSLPSQLAKENKKFIYKLVKSGARAREYEEAIIWLDQAGLINRAINIEKPNIPLKAYEDISSYKLFTFETGLLMRLAGLDPKVFVYGDLFFKEFKGSLVENYVAQCLKMRVNKNLYYWTSAGKAELDFLVEYQNKVVPIEVKSGSQTKAKSLAVYKQKYNPQLRIRISNLNLNLTDDLLNVPLFYADKLDVLVSKINRLNTQ